MSENTKKTRHRKRRSSIVSYFTMPIIYVAISLVVIIPICFVMFSYATSALHEVQPEFLPTAYDISLNDLTYTASDVTSGEVKLPVINYGDKIGELTASTAGISTSVYAGSGRKSLEKGAGLKRSEVLPGVNGTFEIHGRASGEFRGLKNLKKGDEINLNTSWGDYTYTVSETVVSDTAPESSMPQAMLLVCADDTKVFSNFNDDKLYVLADCKTGPQASNEEVQQ